MDKPSDLMNLSKLQLVKKLGAAQTRFHSLQGDVGLIKANLATAQQHSEHLQECLDTTHTELLEANEELEQRRRGYSDLKDTLAEVINTMQAARVADARLVCIWNEANEEYNL